MSDRRGTTVQFPGVANPARDDAPPPGTESGYLAVPASGSGPGVVVAHAWWGLNDTFRDVADRLAENGFVALAPDVYGDGTFATTIEDADARSSAIDPVRAEQTVLGAAERLRSDPATAPGPIGVIGFSMGANYAWWLPKKRPDIGAVVMFYSPGDTGDIAASNAPVQLHWSPDDAYEDPPYIESFSQAMRGSGRGYEDYSYPGRAHWFFEPDRPEYHREDAEKGWDRIVAFFRRELDSGASR